MTITKDDIRIELSEYKSCETPTHVGELFMRFMSLSEYDKLMKGVELFNERRHASHANSSSEGFCFMSVKSMEEAESTVRYCHEYLSGIVSDDVAVIFRNESAHLMDSWGVYADPYGDYYDLIYVDEFCTKCYDRDSMIPVMTILPEHTMHLEYKDIHRF